MKRLAWLSMLGALVVVATNPVRTQVTGSLTTFTLAEPIRFTALVTGPKTGFNGHDNAFRVSADGRFRLEAFRTTGNGHFHTADPQGTSDNITGSDQEENHSWAASGSVGNLQGMRLTRVDEGRFNVVSMELRGGVAIGPALREDPTDGTWRLWTGDMIFTGNPNPAPPFPYSSPSASYELARTYVADLQQRAVVHFNNVYYGATELYFADPSATGVTTMDFARNAWDNIVIESLP